MGWGREDERGGKPEREQGGGGRWGNKKSSGRNICIGE
jgi:hypothetical protein